MADPFAKAFATIQKTAKNNAVAYQKQFSVDSLTSIARGTETDTGRATGNWQADINSPNLSPVAEYDQTKTATPTAKRAMQALRGLKPGQDVFISNAVQGESGGKGQTGLKDRPSNRMEGGKFNGEGYIIQEESRSKMVARTMARAKSISSQSIKQVFK